MTQHNDKRWGSHNYTDQQSEPNYFTRLVFNEDPAQLEWYVVGAGLRGKKFRVIAKFID